MKVGIVGTGGIAHTHAKAILAAGHELTAVTDIDAQRAQAFAATWKTRATASIEELVAEKIDLVTIAAPNRFHFDLAAQSLKAGHAVLCEKPLTGTTGQSLRLVELARRQGRPLFVGYMKRAHPVMQRFQQYASKIGPMRSGILRIHLPCDLKVWDDIAAALKKNPADPRYDGGMLAMVASHMLDLLLWTAGPVKRVVGARLQYRPGCPTMDSDAHALLEMESGASVVMECCFLPLTGTGRRENGRDEMIELRGDSGLARVFTPWADRPEIDAPVAEHWDEATKSWEGSTVNNVNYYTREFEYIALALKGESVPLARGEDGLRVDDLVEQIGQAARCSLSP
jgi:predicted dehydrogenase